MARFPFRMGFLLLAGALLGCGHGGGGFDPGQLWVGFDAQVADLDGDGRNDVVLASFNGGAGHLQVLLQTTPGTLARADYPAGQGPWRCLVADLDGDGVPDLLFADSDARKVSWCRQDPADRGRFQAAQGLDSGLAAYGLAVADLNGDGLPDVAVGDSVYGATRMGLRCQDPARPGTFLPRVDLTLPGPALTLLAGDLDGDGRADLVAWVTTSGQGAPLSGEVGVMAQRDDGPLGPFTRLAAFQDRNTYRMALSGPPGRRDLVVYLLPGSNATHPSLAVLRQGADGAFSAPVATDVFAVPGRDDAAFADLDGDGLTDAVLVGVDGDLHASLTVLRQGPGGTFTRAGTYALPDLARTVAVGDLDGDGRPDLVTVTDANVPYVLTQAPGGTFLAPRALR